MTYILATVILYIPKVQFFLYFLFLSLVNRQILIIRLGDLESNKRNIIRET